MLLRVSDCDDSCWVIVDKMLATAVSGRSYRAHHWHHPHPFNLWGGESFCPLLIHLPSSKCLASFSWFRANSGVNWASKIITPACTTKAHSPKTWNSQAPVPCAISSLVLGKGGSAVKGNPSTREAISVTAVLLVCPATDVGAERAIPFILCLLKAVVPPRCAWDGMVVRCPVSTAQSLRRT